MGAFLHVLQNLMLYTVPVDTSPVAEGATLFKYQLLMTPMKYSYWLSFL